MRLQYAFLARYAELGQDGIFTAVGGGITGIQPTHLPITIPGICLVLKVVADTGEFGDFRLSIGLTNVENEPVVGASADISITIGQDPARREIACLVQMQGLQIQRAGMHQFRIGVAGGLEIGTVPFTVDEPKLP